MDLSNHCDKYRDDSSLLETTAISVGEGVSDLRTDSLDNLMICGMSGVLLSIISNLILTSSTIDKKLEIYTKLEIELEINKNLEYELEIDKNLENFESNFEFFVNFEFYFEFFVISSFLSMVDELTIKL